MKRHPALVPLSHDHHHGLVQARRLRRAAKDADPEPRLRAASAFLAFFEHEGAAHFREEEELLLPFLAGRPDPAASLLVQVAVEHAEIRALVRDLRESLAADTVERGLLGRLGTLLEGHIRLEERQLFPLIEELASERDLEGLSLPPRTLDPVTDETPIVDLTSGRGTGPLWGTASEDLNATLLAWGPGHRTPEQANPERDVLLVGVDGTAEVRLAGASHPFGAGRAVVVEKGTSFSVAAGAMGVRYLSVHLRRPRLQIAARAASPRDG
jgi:hemerythrin-like domain-containing protein